jgi:hypothetical protein
MNLNITDANGELLVELVNTNITTAFQVTKTQGVIAVLDTTGERTLTSVTNAAAVVVEALKQTFGYLREVVIYRDTEDCWARLNHDGEHFTGYAPVIKGQDLKGLDVEGAIRTAVQVELARIESNPPEEIEIELSTGARALLSYQNRLIMLHSDFISAQWEPDSVGINLERIDDRVDVCFWPSKSPNNYQRWSLAIKEYYKVRGFFVALGYPVVEQPHMMSPDIEGTTKH